MPDFLPHVRPPVPGATAPASSVPPNGAEPSSAGNAEEMPQKVESSIWKEYYGVLFLSVVGLFLIGTLVLIQPLIAEYRQLSGAAMSTNEELTDERAYLVSLQGSISAARSIPPETLLDVDEALPRTAGIPKLLQILSLLAQEQNVQLTGVTFAASPETDGTGGQTVAMDIDVNVVTSGYDGLRKFLDGLERNLRLFDVQTITVSAEPEEVEAGAGQSQSIRIRTYSLPPPPSS